MPEHDPTTVGLLLVDTGVFVAAADADEPRHRACAELLAAHRGRLATTSPASPRPPG